MQSCPHCAKKIKDNFEYCRFCGTKLSGENPGDFTTEMLNVFSHEDGFIYLFSDKGSQVVLKAGSIDELASMAKQKRYPWGFKNKSKNSPKKEELVKTPRYVPDFEVSQVKDSSDDFFSDIDFSNVKPKRNPSRQKTELSEDEISKEYGIRGVSKKNGLWSFRTNEVDYNITEKSLKRLKGSVMSKGLEWEVVDEDLADETLRKDNDRIRRSDDEILKRRAESEEFWQEKSQFTRELTQKRTGELKDKLARKNMDKILK